QVTAQTDLSPDPDLQILGVSTADIPPIYLYNIYNQNTPTLNTRVIDRILMNPTYTLPKRTIITGDFNAHHPWWNSTRPAKNADSIITVANQHSLHLLNTPDTPTYILRNGNGTSVLDLTFTTPELHNEV